MSQPTRTVELDVRCPRCGGAVRGVQVGHMVEEDPEPVRWTLLSRFCASGCQLTVSDWPPDQQM
jgi:hypothetical protein